MPMIPAGFVEPSQAQDSHALAALVFDHLAGNARRRPTVKAKPVKTTRVVTVGCKVEGCKEKHHTFGFCKNHASRYKRYGDPLEARYVKVASCRVEGCKQPGHYRKGFCDKHRKRVRRRQCSDER